MEDDDVELHFYKTTALIYYGNYVRTYLRLFSCTDNGEVDKYTNYVRLCTLEGTHSKWTA